MDVTRARVREAVATAAAAAAAVAACHTANVSERLREAMRGDGRASLWMRMLFCSCSALLPSPTPCSASSCHSRDARRCLALSHSRFPRILSAAAAVVVQAAVRNRPRNKQSALDDDPQMAVVHTYFPGACCCRDTSRQTVRTRYTVVTRYTHSLTRFTNCFSTAAAAAVTVAAPEAACNAGWCRSLGKHESLHGNSTHGGRSRVISPASDPVRPVTTA